MYRLQDLSRRQAVIACVLVLALLVPFGVSVARAINVSWLPSGDDALIGLRARDVLGSDPPLVGQPSTSHLYGSDEGTSHPGPIEFYWLAIPMRVFGPSIGMILAILAINLASVAIACWVVLRRAGPTVAAWSMVVVSFVLWSVGSAVLTDPISSNAGGIALLGLAALAWAVADGDVRLAPLAVVFASWVGQQHLAIVVPTVALVMLATGAVTASGAKHWWLRRYRPEVAPERHRRWPWLASAVLVGLACWSPVLWQQATGDPGNISAVAEYARTSDVAKLGPAAGVRQAARAVGKPPLLVRSDLEGDDFFNGPMSPIEVATALVVASSLAGVVLRFWSRRRSLALLGVTAFVLAGAGAYNGAKIPDSVEAFRVNFYRWTFVVAWLVWIAMGWAAGLALLRWSGRRAKEKPIVVPRWAPLAAALMMLVPAAGTTFTAGFDDERRDQAGFETMRQLSDVAIAESFGAQRVTLVLRGRSSVVAVGSAMTLQMEDQGLTVVLPDQDPRFWGDHRVLRCGDYPGEVILMVSSGRGDLPPAPGRLVERVDLNAPLRSAVLQLSAVAVEGPVVVSAEGEELLAASYPAEQRSFIRGLLAAVDTDPARVFTNPELLDLIAQGYYESPHLDPEAIEALRSGPAPVIVNDEDVFEIRVLTPAELALVLPDCKEP